MKKIILLLLLVWIKQLNATNVSPSSNTAASLNVTISPPINTYTYCTGVPYQFTGNANSGTVLWYQWSCISPVGVTILNSACSTCNGPTFTFANTGTYSLTLIVNMNTGLNDTATFSLTVVQTPTIQTSPSILNVCQGGSVGNMIYVSGAGAAGNYTWSPMINIVTTYTGGDSVLINPPNTGVYSYSVVGTSTGGCASLPKVVTATVSAPPLINAHATDDSICSYLNTSVHMDPSYPVIGTTYTWTATANANLGTPYSQSSAVSPIYSGNVDTTFVYYGNLTVPGCPAYPTFTVYVVVVPSPTVHVVSDTVTNCNHLGDSLKVTGNPTTSVNFIWAPSSGLSATTGSGVFANPNSPKTYYVTPSIQVGSNICVGKRDSVKVLICVVGVNELSNEKSIVVFPNPSTGEIIFDAKQNKGHLIIYNVVGEKVFEINIDNTPIKINLCASGVYHSCFTTQAGVFTKKIVVTD